MNIEEIKHILSQLKPEHLPGLVAHRKLAPFGRIHLNYESEPANAVKSSVLILLNPDKQGELCFSVIRRTADNSAHSRQISLPGGRFEPEDDSFATTAIRETSEEIGVPMHEIEILAALSPLYIPVSNYTIYPFVGYMPSVPNYVPAIREVAEILEIGFQEMLDIKIQEKTIQVGEKTFEAPFMFFKNVELWGATAMILQEFSEVFTLVNSLKSTE